MALPEHLAEFERKVAARLSDAVDEMRRSLHAQAERASSQLLTEIESFRPALPARLLDEQEVAGLSRPSRQESRAEVLRELKGAMSALDGAATQGDALEALLEAAQGDGRRAALWLVRDEGLVGWGSAGFATNGDDPLAGVRLAFGAAPALERLAQGRGAVRLGADDAARLAGELDVRAPRSAALVPLVLRDRLAAALYVDRLEGGDDLELELVQLVAYAAAQRLELQALSSRPYTPTLVLDDEAPREAAGLPLWDPDALGGAVAAPAAELAFAEPAPHFAPAVASWEAPLQEPVFEFEPAAAPEPAAADEQIGIETEAMSLPLFPAVEAAAPPALPEVEAEPETLYEPATELSSESTPAFDFGHPELDAPPAEKFVLQPPPMAPMAPTAPMAPAAPMAPLAPEGSAAEIAWEMEEADSTVLIGGSTAPPSALDEVTTGRIPLAPVAFQREISAGSEIIESTAEFVPPSPAATQAFRTGAIATHEFALPEPSAPPARTDEPDLSDDATVLVRRAAPIAAPSAPLANATVALPVEPPSPAAPIAGVDDEPTVSRSRTTEVLPPPDVQGPGWAFTSSRAQRPSGENALHEEARRLARLLISEIKLYNEEQVEEGRRNRDIYHRLKDDIDRSRQIFEERVHESVRSSTDYFQQELVRSLAGGDPRALGI
jgi:hypothetical protein